MAGYHSKSAVASSANEPSSRGQSSAPQSFATIEIPAAPDPGATKKSKTPAYGVATVRAPSRVPSTFRARAPSPSENSSETPRAPPSSHADPRRTFRRSAAAVGRRRHREPVVMAGYHSKSGPEPATRHRVTSIEGICRAPGDVPLVSRHLHASIGEAAMGRVGPSRAPDMRSPQLRVDAARCGRDQHPERRLTGAEAHTAENRTSRKCAYLVMIVAEFGQWLALIVYAYARGGASGGGPGGDPAADPVDAPRAADHGALARIGVARLLAVAYAAAAATLACCGLAILAGAPVFVVYLAAVAFSLSLGVSRPLHHVLMPLVVRHPDELTAANIATSWSEGVGGVARPGARRCADQRRWPRSRVCGARRPVPVHPDTGQRAPAARRRAGGRRGGGRSLRSARRRPRDPLPAEHPSADRVPRRSRRDRRRGRSARRRARRADSRDRTRCCRLSVLQPSAQAACSAPRRRAVCGPSARAAAGSPPRSSAALALGALALVSTVLVAVLLLALVGAARTVQSVTPQTLLQRSTPLDVIVCAFALIESMRDLGMAFSALIVPLLIGLGGANAAFVGMACLALVAVLATARRIRRIDSEASIPVVEMGMLRNMGIFSALPAAPLETLAREGRYVTRHPSRPRSSARARRATATTRSRTGGPGHERRARDQAAGQRRRLRGDRAAVPRHAYRHRHRDERDHAAEHWPRGLPHGDARPSRHLGGRRAEGERSCSRSPADPTACRQGRRTDTTLPRRAAPWQHCLPL